MPKANHTSAGAAKPSPDLRPQDPPLHARSSILPPSNHTRWSPPTKIQILHLPHPPPQQQHRSPNQPRVWNTNRHGYEIFGRGEAGTLFAITWLGRDIRME